MTVALTLLCGALLVPLHASAAPGYTSATVNMRAGPGTSYPILVTIRAGVPVEIVGCLSGSTWCDVSLGGERGWVSGRYLSTSWGGRSVPLYRQPPAVVSFDLPNYWDAYYVNRPFYRDRDRWHARHRANVPAPRPVPAWAHPDPGNQPVYSAPGPGPSGQPQTYPPFRSAPCQRGAPGCR